MLTRSYAPAPRARFEILLILILACHTEAASNGSLMSSSSDVWAALVANVGPLLVLVGEKHVKAYFKIMCHPSHHLLFASAPIGLVTAVTTLIRLDGGQLLKRLIGRQFETRAEVLADATSISGGEVGLELRNMGLEQTTQPTDEDLAMFWVHGRTKGFPEEVLKTFSDWTETLLFIRQVVTGPPSLYSDRRCSWEIMMSFKATGTCPQWVARKHAAESRNLQELLERCESKIAAAAKEISQSVATCTASAGVYARFTGVSLDITASINHDKGKLKVMRYATIAFCLMGNVGIIVASGLIGGTVAKSVLVSLGLAGSAYGCWLTARAVDLMSKEVIIDTSKLSATASGFFSHRTPGGAKLSNCPKQIALSSVRPRRWAMRDYMRGSSATIITALMVISYFTLYLGLRACDWWVSIAMLGNSAIAAVARSILVPRELYLIAAGPRSPNPMTCRIGCTTDREDLAHQSEGPGASPDARAGSVLYQGGRVLSEPLDAGVYEVIVCVYRYEGGPSRAYEKIQPYMWTAFTLAAEMSKRGILPLEMRGILPQRVGAGGRGTACIFSDIITRRGIWRQPLEVIVHPGGQSVPERILAVFWGWYWRAPAHQAQKVASIELPPDLVNRFIDLGDDEKRFDIPTDKLKTALGSFTTPREIVWMGAKLCYASFYYWEWNMFEAQREAWFASATDEYLRYTQISSLLDAIVEAGLTCPRAP
ncbi:hypothetical protein C7212DRAFT_367021 [Tuber magnatum]|uniref:Uncharacterized protein n=1 Tax=Tuber magnatum TaxID=42249 RepID=A0A317SFM1_9PEZI|nr:hypothetical protein C7212DRAFT_367021 [Tuber magnatum]